MSDKENSPLKQIRTFQGDVADALKKQHESLVSIQRVEHLKKEVDKSDDSSAKINKKRLEFYYLLLGSFLLVILSILGVWYAYSEFTRKTSAPPIVVPANRFIFANSELTLNLANPSRLSFIETLSNALDDVPDREIRHVVLRKAMVGGTQLLSTNEFLGILESQAPSNLVRAFDPFFMVGAYGNSVFFIIKLSSFENAFAGMLAWEKTINKDLGPLLATREISRNIPIDSVFVDIRDQNKDIRALLLDEQYVLLYSFLDNDTLIITDNLETLRTLVDHLTREKLSR